MITVVSWVSAHGRTHCMNDCIAQALHSLFTYSFQAVSKFGKWTQYASLDTQEVNVILHLWLLVHWVHFPNLETGWKLWVNKPWNSCALKSFLLWHNSLFWPLWAIFSLVHVAATFGPLEMWYMVAYPGVGTCLGHYSSIIINVGNCDICPRLYMKYSDSEWLY